MAYIPACFSHESDTEHTTASFKTKQQSQKEARKKTGRRKAKKTSAWGWNEREHSLQAKCPASLLPVPPSEPAISTQVHVAQYLCFSHVQSFEFLSLGRPLYIFSSSACGPWRNFFRSNGGALWLWNYFAGCLHHKLYDTPNPPPTTPQYHNWLMAHWVH